MKRYEKNELEEVVKNSLSMAEVCRKLKIRPAGGNYKTLNKYIKMYDINKSHFTGQGWNCGERYISFGRNYSLDEILIKNSTYTNSTRLKKKLINDGLKENKCERCGISEWNGKKLSLHLDHINGNNLDNRLENLRILCPNCHSQTETYCNCKIKNNMSEFRIDNYDNRLNLIGKNIKEIKTKKEKMKDKFYCECGKEIKKRSVRCQECDKINQRKVKDRPNHEELIKMVNENGYEAIGKKYGVTGNAIRKWLKRM